MTNKNTSSHGRAKQLACQQLRARAVVKREDAIAHVGGWAQDTVIALERSFNKSKVAALHETVDCNAATLVLLSLACVILPHTEIVVVIVKTNSIYNTPSDGLVTDKVNYHKYTEV